MRSLRLMHATLLLALCSMSCGRHEPPPSIGLAYPPHFRNIEAASLAVVDLEALTGGPPVRLVLDSSLVTDSAPVDVRRAESLVARPNVMAVVGPGNSRGALAAAPVYNAAGVTQLNPQATSRLLSRLGGRTLLMLPNDSIEGAFIARFLAESLAARRVSIFFTNDEYGVGLREGVEAALATRRISVVDKVPFSPQGEFAVLVRSSLQRARPDVVVVAGRVGSAMQIAQLVHDLAPGTEVVAGDGAMLPVQLGALAEAVLADLHVVSYWLPAPDDAAAARFSRRFRALVGREPEPADAYAYDAIMVAAAAIRAAGADRDDVWEWLSSLGGSRPPYPGVTGPIAFKEPPLSHMVMARIHGGRAEAEWPR